MHDLQDKIVKRIQDYQYWKSRYFNPDLLSYKDLWDLGLVYGMKCKLTRDGVMKVVPIKKVKKACLKKAEEVFDEYTS